MVMKSRKAFTLLELMVVVAIVICNGIFGIAGAFFGVPLVPFT